MQFKKLLIISVVGTFAMLAGCGYNKTEHLVEALEVEISSQYPFEFYNLSDSVFESKEQTETLVKETLTDMAEVLKMPYWWEETNPTATKLYLNLSFAKVPRSLTETVVAKCGEDALTGGIMLSTQNYSDGALAHELTHLIGFMGGFSKSLDEGMCDYVYMKCSESNPFPKEWDFQDYVALITQPEYYNEEAKPYFDELFSHIGSAETGYPYGEGKKLSLFYLYSQSYVTYLIDEYGIDQVRDLTLNGSDLEAYQTYLNKDYDTIKSEWIEYILAIEPKLTVEDIMKNTSTSS